MTVGGTPVKTTIEVTGQRLNGNDVHVRYGKLLISKGQNASATQLSVEVSRALPTDQTVSVIVNGFESNILPPSLERLEPVESFPGQPITLIGRGLSGGNVVVHFGGAASMSARILIPAGSSSLCPPGWQWEPFRCAPRSMVTKPTISLSEYWHEPV